MVGHARFLFGSTLLVSALAGAAGCGGSSVKHVGAGEAGESAGGTTGGTPTGGTSGTTGGATTGGTASTTGGTSGVSGCGPIPPCDPIACPGDDYAEPTCGGCPVCCALVDCAVPDCPNGEVSTRLPGDCCETCVPITPLQGCETVMCPGPIECDPDRDWGRAEGTCCESCVPLTAPACVEIACPGLECAPGFAPGNGVNGCCYECVPDPLYCNRNSDCVLAVHIGDECACQEAISWREFNDDICWVSNDSGRYAPASCGPTSTCPCPFTGNVAVCNNDNQCQQITASLK